MSTDYYLALQTSSGSWLEGESGTTISSGKPDGGSLTNPIEIAHFDWSVSMVTSIGSASAGAGAGKVKFNEFHCTYKVDMSLPGTFQYLCTGMHFQSASLLARKTGGALSPYVYLRFDMSIVYLTKYEVSGSETDEPVINMTLAYGAMRVQYFTQDSGTGNVTLFGTGKYDSIKVTSG